MMPGALLAIGLATFGLVGLAGLSVIDRYLLVPSLLVMVFAAVAIRLGLTDRPEPRGVGARRGP